jgi:hypothetical protein
MTEKRKGRELGTEVSGAYGVKSDRRLQMIGGNSMKENT